MTVRTSLLPSIWRRGESLMRGEGGYPFYSLHREMNEMFDDLWQSFDIRPFSLLEEHFETFIPSVDVIHSDGKLTTIVELPGIDEKDIEVLLTEDSLIIKGEKKEEKEVKGDYCRTERTHGQFIRVIQLPQEIDTAKVEARFKNGVLSIDMPIREEVKAKGTKVPIKVE
jgi:HSP20 family protein